MPLTKHLNTINTPRRGDRIYKDECVYSFDTPVRYPCLFLFSIPPGATSMNYRKFFFIQDSSSGLYVSLTSFLGLSQEHVMWYYNKTSYPVYLHIKRTRKEVILIYSRNYIEDLVSLSGTLPFKQFTMSFIFKVSDECFANTRYSSIVVWWLLQCCLICLFLYLNNAK